MKFKDLSINNFIYSFDTNEIKYCKYSVIKVSQPRLDVNVLNSTVVDITLDNNLTLVFKSDDNYGEKDGIFYTTDLESVINKIKYISNSIKIRLDAVPKLKSNKESCDKLLSELDPEIKERQENEKRLSNVENKINDFSADLSDIKKYLKKLLDDSKNK